MGKLKNFITPLHKLSKRNYIQRMNDNKPECMKVAKKFSKLYWDGNRRYGYGGYKYIPGRWAGVAKRLIKNYKLSNNSKVLDVGCGKGFLLYEMFLLQPELALTGIDISKYAINSVPKDIKENVFIHDAQEKYPFKKNKFDLVISLGTLHNFDLSKLKIALNEINRVSKSSYIMVESYRNDRELFNLQCWALTCKSFYTPNEWKWMFKEYNYKGDYEFIFFE